MNVLIVDDKAENICLLRAMLEGSGYGVVSASNGEEALKQLREGSFDLIVSDILMPVMDGFQLCRECKTRKEWRDIPFIFYTATYTEKPDEDLALSLGADRFVVKPQAPEAFLALMKEVLELSIQGKGARRPLATPDEPTFWAAHGERTARKLEKKMVDLAAVRLALRESEYVFRTIFDNAGEGILIADATTQRFLQGNAAISSMLGYAQEEIVNLSIQDIHLPSDLPRVFATVEKQLKGEVVLAENMPVLRKNGTIFYADIGATPAILEGRNCLVGIFRDITDRKQAEEAFAQVAREWQMTFDSTNDAIWILDREQRVLRANKTAVRFFARPPEEMIGRHCWEIVHGTTQPIPECPIHCGRNSLHRETKELREGDRWFEVIVDPILDEAGLYAGAVHIVSDITERKQAEEEKQKLHGQLIQSQKMESVGRLAGGVAHDFNNMLGVILGRAELALAKIDPAHPHINDLIEIRKAAERSADLTRQLLAFARKQVVSPRVLDVNDMVAELLKMLQRLIGEDIRLVWLPGMALWPVKMDPSQIDQILVNLIVNARDAVSGEGKLEIETGNVSLDAADCTGRPGLTPGAYVRLTVSDDGCGMDPETLGRIFEPYFTTKGAGKGTGLGLATVYGIVKQNEGFIDVQSQPNQGTTFRIYLPRYNGRIEEIKAERMAEPARRGHETVLVVEDEPALLELTKIILEKQGYRILTASTPGEALRLAGEQPGEIHLLLTDVVLPEMNGRDLAQKFLSLHPHAQCLFASGYTDEVIARHGILDEGLHFIQKPFTGKNLVAKVRETLDQRKVTE